MKIYFEDEPRDLSVNDTLLKDYRKITAAGGVVVNDEGRILMIFRRGKWDLPKGKFEAGETIEACAEREIIEETGLTTVSLQKPLLVSYHTYTDKKIRYLKDTHWFLFEAPGTQNVVPQTVEGITRIDWVAAEELPGYTSNTYGLIKDVLAEAGYRDL